MSATAIQRGGLLHCQRDRRTLRLAVDTNHFVNGAVDIRLMRHKELAPVPQLQRDRPLVRRLNGRQPCRPL
jgi:hypothetical protein